MHKYQVSMYDLEYIHNYNHHKKQTDGISKCRQCGAITLNVYKLYYQTLPDRKKDFLN